MGMTEEKRPLGRPTFRWEGTITMDLREVGWGDMEQIDGELRIGTSGGPL
jgi:hypothetical protein